MLTLLLDPAIQWWRVLINESWVLPTDCSVVTRLAPSDVLQMGDIGSVTAAHTYLGGSCSPSSRYRLASSSPGSGTITSSPASGVLRSKDQCLMTRARQRGSLLRMPHLRSIVHRGGWPRGDPPPPATVSRWDLCRASPATSTNVIPGSTNRLPIGGSWRSLVTPTAGFSKSWCSHSASPGRGPVSGSTVDSGVFDGNAPGIDFTPMGSTMPLDAPRSSNHCCQRAWG